MIYRKLDILGAPLTVYAPDNSPEIEPNRLHPAVSGWIDLAVRWLKNL